MWGVSSYHVYVDDDTCVQWWVSETQEYIPFFIDEPNKLPRIVNVHGPFLSVGDAFMYMAKLYSWKYLNNS